MAGPRRDTRGIVDAPGLFTRVRFRRHEPAPALRPYLEHYWLIDWDLTEPYVSHVVPHPSVNVVFQRHPGLPAYGEVAGVGLELSAHRLEGAGRVCGVQFRPGGFRPFAPRFPVSRWTGLRVPLAAAFPGVADDAAARVLDGGSDAERVAALDAFLLARDPEPSRAADRATELVGRVRADRGVRRVAAFAAAEGMSVRSMQRLFAAYVGVSPKWVVLRYRIHEALERAATGAGTDWAALAADLGYSDQAHLVRDFTATVGVPPSAYAR
ncbi:helix-turn-helix domain-containing protein [Streptomyces sp. Z26]|uniref:helix-turn-helix domain-containing protein n=1 Tax=Streptomyces sp. Z26 TaxID=2500177 RepID=UPI000EF166F8|nr:helix-turn-helix domain-containing protein [Streptomyces sp. Z26]RLL65648.1 AraC family transcriptional regulator [Streptomyces sp. Z26]